jgi:hypothetical protein
MSGIFISYRRADASGWAGRLAAGLRQTFPNNAVFLDVASIEVGEDFLEAIQRSLASSSVAIVVIGPRWLDDRDDSGRRRIDDPDDWVRLELEASLRHSGLRIIPVLVGAARMPVSAAMPEPLRALARRNAQEITDSRWDYDFSLLVNALRKIISTETPRDAAQKAETDSKTEQEAEPKGGTGSDVLRRIVSLNRWRATPLKLPKAIYGGMDLSPNGRTLYLTRYRETIDGTPYYDLLEYDLNSGMVSDLGDVGCATIGKFMGETLLMWVMVEKYKTHRIVRFEAGKRVQSPDDDIVFSSSWVVHGKLVYQKEGQFYVSDQRGNRTPLDFGTGFCGLQLVHPERNIVLLAYSAGEASRGSKRSDKQALYEHRLVKLDDRLNIDTVLWTYKDSGAAKLLYMRRWTRNSVLFVEATDTNNDGVVNWDDRRNSVVKSLELSSWKVSTLVPDGLELHFLAGHDSGLVLYADEVEKYKRTCLRVLADGTSRDVLELQGGVGCFNLDAQWKTLVYLQAFDTSRKANFYPSENESNVFSVDLS